MLAYAEKCVAVRALKKNFIEGIDFVSLDQNVKRAIGGTVTHNYMLSTSCLEYFIARKVRPVFEVYRQVFHKTVKQKPQMQEALTKYDKLLNESLSQTEEGLRQIRNLNEQLWEEKARTEIVTLEKAKETEMKNSMIAFLLEMKLYGKWMKYNTDRQLKETVNRLKKEKQADEMRPYELPL